MAIEFTESAGKHGYSREDALHAMLHYRMKRTPFDTSRVKGRRAPDLYVGPSLDPRHPLLEVMVETIPPNTVVIFHVMPAREKFLRLMDEED